MKRFLLLIIIAALLLSGCTFYLTSGQSTVRMITKQDMAEDLYTMMENMYVHHPKFEEGELHYSDVEDKVNEIINNLPDEMPVNLFFYYLSSVLELTNDPHSAMNVDFNERGQMIDVETVFTEGTIYVSATQKNNKYFEVGDRIVKIGDYDYDNIIEKLNGVISNSNKEGIFRLSNQILRDKYFYEYIGAVDKKGKIKFTIEKVNGKTKTVNVKLSKMTKRYYIRFASSDEPHYNPYEEYYSEFDTDSSTAIAHINVCEYTDEFKNFMQDFYKTAKDESYKKIVIDLRNNLGGSIGFIYYIMMGVDADSFTYIDGITYNNAEKENEYISDTKMYILTYYGTGSASIVGSAIFKYNKFATIVGTYPGDQVDPYYFKSGELQAIQLENSNLTYSVADDKMDVQCPSYDDLRPDVYIEPTRRSIIYGIEPSLQWVKVQ